MTAIHMLVFGPTGAGKSTLLALIAAQFHRYRNARVTAFDKGRSLFTLASRPRRPLRSRRRHGKPGALPAGAA
jgi:ABC-type molybdenum transport system ATPase subunit/photorepair protein PhrA